MELRTWDEPWVGIIDVEEPFDVEELRIIQEEAKKPIIIKRK